MSLARAHRCRSYGEEFVTPEKPESPLCLSSDQIAHESPRLECTSLTRGFFCEFTDPVLQSLDRVSHKTTLPAGAILFVEGQAPRGMFMVCTGRVNLSTTSREGKILILKTANAGEALGLSATISGLGYEATAETATPCQVSFVDRKHYLELMQQHSEIGVHASPCLSREFRSAYHDIHDLVLTRSSAGKLARLLLSQCRKRVGGLQQLRDDPDATRGNGTAHRGVA